MAGQDHPKPAMLRHGWQQFLQSKPGNAALPRGLPNARSRRD
jgi:hypothetical protein